MVVKKFSFFILSFLVCISFFGFIDIAFAGTGTESCYVNSFSATISNWNTHSGSTPWLDNNASNSITAYTDHVVDAIYSFADTTANNYTSVTLCGMVKSNNENHYAAALLYGTSGGAWSVTVNIFDDGDGAYSSFESSTLNSTLTSLARINECRMNLTKHNSGTGTLSLQKVYLKVTFTTGGTAYSQTITDNISVTDGITKNVVKTLVDNVVVSDNLVKNVVLYFVDNVVSVDEILVNSGIEISEVISILDSVSKNIYLTFVDDVDITDIYILNPIWYFSFPKVVGIVLIFLVVSIAIVFEESKKKNG